MYRITLSVTVYRNPVAKKSIITSHGPIEKSFKSLPDARKWCMREILPWPYYIIKDGTDRHLYMVGTMIYGTGTTYNNFRPKEGWMWETSDNNQNYRRFVRIDGSLGEEVKYF